MTPTRKLDYTQAENLACDRRVSTLKRASGLQLRIKGQYPTPACSNRTLLEILEVENCRLELWFVVGEQSRRSTLGNKEEVSW
jgi:hypothetical protein